MKKQALNLILLFATLALSLGLLFVTIGVETINASPVLLAVLAAGVIAGGGMLWRFAAHQKYMRPGWLLLKGLLFNAGWALALGLLISASIKGESNEFMPEDTSSLQEEYAKVEAQFEESKRKLEEANQKLAASAEKESKAELRARRHAEIVAALDSFEQMLKQWQTESELIPYTGPLLEQTSRARNSINAELKKVQQQRTAGDSTTPPEVEAYEQLDAKRKAMQQELINRATKPQSQKLPTLWRNFLCALGFLFAATGIIALDETFVGLLLAVFPFFKGEERKRRENAEKVFQAVRSQLQEDKVSEAYEKSQELESELLTPAQRQEAEFYHAYTTFKEHGAEAALPLLEKHHTQFPGYNLTAYLLGYAYLITQHYKKALAMWERLYGQDKDFLETTYYYSYAALSLARELMKAMKVEEALGLFKIVRDLRVHADAVPEGLHNLQLIEAAGKLRQGDARAAETIFARVENEGRADNTPKGKWVEALGKLGHALVEIFEGRADNATKLMQLAVYDFHRLTGVEKPPEVTADELQSPFEEKPKTATVIVNLNDEATKESKKEADSSAESNKREETQHRTLMRDIYFLLAIAKLLTWIRLTDSQRPNPRDDDMRIEVLKALRNALYYDPASADALALCGFILYFYSNKRSVAASYLTSAKNLGFEEEALIILLQRLEQLAELRTQVRNKILDRLHEYLTNDEVRQDLKKKLLEEESIRNGYREYYGEIKIEGIAEHQPTLADLTARSDYLSKEVHRLIQEMELSGTEQEKLARINEAMASLAARNKELAKVQQDIENQESLVLRESGIFVLNAEF